MSRIFTGCSWKWGLSPVPLQSGHASSKFLPAHHFPPAQGAIPDGTLINGPAVAMNNTSVPMPPQFLQSRGCFPSIFETNAPFILGVAQCFLNSGGKFIFITVPSLSILPILFVLFLSWITEVVRPTFPP